MCWLILRNSSTRHLDSIEAKRDLMSKWFKVLFLSYIWVLRSRFKSHWLCIFLFSILQGLQASTNDVKRCLFTRCFPEQVLQGKFGVSWSSTGITRICLLYMHVLGHLHIYIICLGNSIYLHVNIWRTAENPWGMPLYHAYTWLLR